MKTEEHEDKQHKGHEKRIKGRQEVTDNYHNGFYKKSLQ
jgi:hypothetical protein